MNCVRCKTSITPDTNVPIADIEFCPDCSKYMRGLMQQLGASKTPKRIAFEQQRKQELVKLAEWNAMSRSGLSA